MSMFTNKRIMVVAAHPDDELLGLGATMHKLRFKMKCFSTILAPKATDKQGTTSPSV